MLKKKLLNLLKQFFHIIDLVIKKLFLFFIFFYQKAISVHLPKTCRFTPTCSEYSKQAFLKYNFPKALYLSTKRVLKCHPFHPGGYDPLP